MVLSWMEWGQRPRTGQRSFHSGSHAQQPEGAAQAAPSESRPSRAGRIPGLTRMHQEQPDAFSQGRCALAVLLGTVAGSANSRQT